MQVLMLLALLSAPVQDDKGRRQDKELSREERAKIEAEIEKINAQLREKPDDDEAFLHRGMCYQRLRDPDKAMEDFTRSIELNPKRAQAYIARGMCRMGKGDREGAVKDWDRSVELDPGLKDQVENMKRGPRRQDERRPGEGDPRHGPQDRQDPHRMSEEVRSFLKEFDPERLRRLDEAMESHREDEVQRILHESYGQMMEMRELQRTNPEEYKQILKTNQLERETFVIGDKLRRTPAEDKDNRERLRKELEEKLSQLFDLREQRRMRELQELKRRVEEIEKSLQKRKDNKKAIVEKRLKELSGEKDRDTDW